MINAPYEKEFVFHDGKRAKNLLELSEIVERLSDEEFSQFVNSYKNDFANWIENVLMDKKFSDKLRLTISREQARTLFRDKMREVIAADYALSNPSKEIKEESKSGAKIVEQNPEQKPEENVLRDLAKEHPAEHIEHPAEHQAEHAREHEHAAGKSPKTEPVRGKWFEFFGRKALSKKNLEKTADAESDKARPAIELKEQVEENKTENTLWMMLYGLLIGLIIILLVYKFVFQK